MVYSESGEAKERRKPKKITNTNYKNKDSKRDEF